MSVQFVDLKAQYESIKAEIDQAMSSVIESTSFIGGPIVSKFEEGFAKYLGVKNCVGCANGTDSMEIILKAMGIGLGDEVLVPANSWISTAEVVNNVGAEPVFVDVIEEEYTIDPALIQKVITPKTKAIIPVHLFGLPARMPEIMEIANSHQIKVIEDCAQAHGASLNGQKVGTFGHAASFSFYPGKNLGAYGDAGGIVTNDDDLAKDCRMLGNHGQLSKHDHQIVGRNSRMDTMQAAILSVKLAHLDNWLAQRQKVAGWYQSELNSSIIKPFTPPKSEHVFHLFVIRSEKREVLRSLFSENGIGHAIHYPTPLPLVDAYGYKSHSAKDFPVAFKLSQEIISLPLFPEMSKEQVVAVSTIVNGVK